MRCIPRQRLYGYLYTAAIHCPLPIFCNHSIILLSLIRTAGDFPGNRNAADNISSQCIYQHKPGLYGLCHGFIPVLGWRLHQDNLRHLSWFQDILLVIKVWFQRSTNVGTDLELISYKPSLNLTTQDIPKYISNLPNIYFFQALFEDRLIETPSQEKV